MGLFFFFNELVGHGTEEASKPRPFPPERVAVREKRRPSHSVDSVDWYDPVARDRPQIELEEVCTPPKRGVAAKNNEKPEHRFVLYSLRHTFLTRLEESGCDVWMSARIAGHGQIGISSRYFHPCEDAMFAAMSGCVGPKLGTAARDPGHLGSTMFVD